MHFDARLLRLLFFLFNCFFYLDAFVFKTYFTPLDIETLESVKIERELGLSCRVYEIDLTCLIYTFICRQLSLNHGLGSERSEGASEASSA